MDIERRPRRILCNHEPTNSESDTIGWVGETKQTGDTIGGEVDVL